MLHTIVPLEMVFGSEDFKIENGDYFGARAEFVLDEFGRKKIGRVYSTDLKAYLGL